MFQALYTQLAAWTFLLAAVVVAGAGMVYSFHNPGRMQSLWSRPVRRAALAVIAAQAIGTVGAALLLAGGLISDHVLRSYLNFWFYCLLGAVALPMGLALDERDRPPPRLREGSAVAIAIIGVIAVSHAWMGLWKTVLAALDVTIIVNPRLQEQIDSRLALAAAVPLTLVAAVVEEVIFRLGLQGLLEKQCRRWRLTPWVAIAAASLVWSLCHANFINVPGIKEGQIFLVGLVFGWLKWRYGPRACVAGHLGLNAGVILLEVLNPSGADP